MNPRRTLLLVWLAYLAFVVYGSLVPLDYQPRPWDEAWRLFQHIRLLDVGAQGRADWIANGVLYLPLAFLTAHVLADRRARPSPLALGSALLFCLMLAVTVEFVQLFFPPRTVSLNDLLAEGIGSLLGVSLAVAWGGRIHRLLAALGSVGLPALWLKAYALAYFALSLFPYDFLVSGAELADKAASQAWGLTIAPDAWHGSPAIALAKLLVEALAVAPLGFLAARGIGTPAHWSPVRALGVGALLGLVIEFAQFFLVSGVSQGVSLLTRALGFLAGATLARQPDWLRPNRLAGTLRHHALPLTGVYLLTLAAVNGWFERRWLGLEHARAVLDGVRFLPFYYHYYTTEQAALTSLLAVVFMYAPIGLMGWAFWVAPVTAAALAGLLAVVVETAKLFLAGLRPDPTNVLLAGFAAWAAAHMRTTSSGDRCGPEAWAGNAVGRSSYACDGIQGRWRAGAGCSPLHPRGLCPAGRRCGPDRLGRARLPGPTHAPRALPGRLWGTGLVPSPVDFPRPASGARPAGPGPLERAIFPGRVRPPAAPHPGRRLCPRAPPT